MDKELKHALWLLMNFNIHRYLMSNAQGRWNGAEKAMCHIELCKLYVAVVRLTEPDAVMMEHMEDWKAVHDKTQELTDHLDEVIGFPLSDTPDYDNLAPLFFEKFITLAGEALGHK
jgi:hypothetical protein